MDRCWSCGDYIINEDGKGCLCDRAKENTIRLESRVRELEAELIKIALVIGSPKDAHRLPDALTAVLSSYRNRGEKAEAERDELKRAYDAVGGIGKKKVTFKFKERLSNYSYFREYTYRSDIDHSGTYYPAEEVDRLVEEVKNAIEVLDKGTYFSSSKLKMEVKP